MWSFGANNKPDTFLDLRQLGTNPNYCNEAMRGSSPD